MNFARFFSSNHGQKADKQIICPFQSFLKESPKDITSIKRKMFAKNQNLTSILIPRSIQRIEEGAFEHSSVVEVIFESSTSLQAIHAFAFSYCSQLKEVRFLDIDADVNMIHQNTRQGQGTINISTQHHMRKKRLFWKPKSPHRTLEIHKCAFFRCTSLASITIPSHTTIIYEEAFAESGLFKVRFESTLLSPQFYPNVFRGCMNLSHVYARSSIWSELSMNFFSIFPSGESLFSKFFQTQRPPLVDTTHHLTPNAFQGCPRIVSKCFPEDFIPCAKSSIYSKNARHTHENPQIFRPFRHLLEIPDLTRFSIENVAPNRLKLDPQRFPKKNQVRDINLYLSNTTLDVDSGGYSFPTLCTIFPKGNRSNICRLRGLREIPPMEGQKERVFPNSPKQTCFLPSSLSSAQIHLRFSHATAIIWERKSKLTSLWGFG